MSLRFKVALARGALVAITIGVLIVTFFGTLPMFETRYFPVVGKLNIERVEPASDDRSIVYSSFTKLRQCDFLGISWFKRVGPDRIEQVPIELLRKPGDISSPTRPLGLQSSGPWIVGIAPEEVRQTSVVELTHRCHPFWTTVTQFYP